MCPNMTWNTVPLGGHAHSHTIQLTAPPSQHLIEQTRTTTGRRSVALSTLTLRWRRREMSHIWFGHSALRQKVLDEPIVDVSTGSKQSSKQTKKQTRMWPKKLYRGIPSDEKLDKQQSEIWLVEPRPLWTNKKTSQRHDTSCNRPPQSRQNESNDPLVLNVKNMFFLEISMHKHEQQQTDTLLHLPLPHWEDCREKKNKEDLVKSLCDRGVPDELITDVSSDATHWPTNKPNEPETSRIENMVLRHSFWSRPFARTTSLARTWALWTSTVSTLNLPDWTQYKNSNTHEQTIFNFTNVARMITIQILTGKQREYHELLQILTENHVNITNHSTISSTHCPHAIRRIALQSQHACGLALMNITYCNHSAKDLHLSISTWTQRRRLRGMNQKWPRHVALRKRVLDELIMDVWTETIQHEENAEREKHEQTVILKSNSGWKTFWKKQPQCESESRMETKLVALPHHFTHKNGNQQRRDTSSNTLWPTLQNDSNFTAPSMTKKHAFPDVS